MLAPYRLDRRDGEEQPADEPEQDLDRHQQRQPFVNLRRNPRPTHLGCSLYWGAGVASLSMMGKSGRSLTWHFSARSSRDARIGIGRASWRERGCQYV